MKYTSIILGIVIICIAILYETQSYEKYTAINESQLELIKDNEQINILQYQNLVNDRGSSTVIAYTDSNEVGAIVATNKNGKLDYSKSMSIPTNSEDKVYILGAISGLKYLIIMFQDDQLLQNTKQIIIYRGSQFQKIEDVSKSLIINTDTLYSTESSSSLHIDFLNKNGNILHRYPSNIFPSGQVDFYDFYYSKKTIELMEGATNAKLKIDLDLSSISSIHDAWLYTMSAEIDKGQSRQILDFVESLNSNLGYYYANSKEKYSDSSNSTLYTHLVDTKMALETLKVLNGEVSTQKTSEYLNKTIIELNQTNLNFVSKGGLTLVMKQISDLIGETPGGQKELNYDSIASQLTSLYNIKDLSLESYSTLYSLQEHSINIPLNLNKTEISKYIYDRQLPNGLFNIDNTREGYDVLSTFNAVKLLIALELDVPNKEKLLRNLKKINQKSIINSI
ncbi:hypothetical protein [Paenibacillus massiliensis]|uniref:hypothetical protein n=1 Tax=Paenibacillus massiliensis TaxID=225917 RepID=UPI0003FD3F91|nr:hypothetical protein [Paenibacillus massiliensis]